MMTLTTQLRTFLFSFIFGFLYFFMILLNKKKLFHKKLFVKIISCFFFCLITSIIYFLGIRVVNDGVLHIYFSFFFFFGCIFGWCVSFFLLK